MHIPERSAETGASGRVLYRKISALKEWGMESLFASPKAKRRVLPPAIRRKIVDLKADNEVGPNSSYSSCKTH